MSLIEIGTWISVAVLGPGALAVFIWFLIDLRRMFSHKKQ